ncbi:hypothetical protein DOTSEDRAFT_20554 [Dothistroma septosporum NZE10]|uniref:Uncharacterized protein n=1 Tax=Dothistroma septosporum (strain NZE10 / CBS 128990) TaxID=675120 RepID=N1Q4E3_DOTSN|nr:hypothetical protein DOTSEDRAFT_20554 [Dothistroma septosporum NZE10]
MTVGLACELEDELVEDDIFCSEIGDADWRLLDEEDFWLVEKESLLAEVDEAERWLVNEGDVLLGKKKTVPVEAVDVDDCLVKDDEGALLEVEDVKGLVEDGECALLEDLDGMLDNKAELSFMRELEVELVISTALELVFAGSLCVADAIALAVELDMSDVLDLMGSVDELAFVDALRPLDRLVDIGKLVISLSGRDVGKVTGNAASGVLLVVPEELGVVCDVTAPVETAGAESVVPVLKLLSSVAKVLVELIALICVPANVKLVECATGSVVLVG